MKSDGRQCCNESAAEGTSPETRSGGVFGESWTEVAGERSGAQERPPEGKALERHISDQTQLPNIRIFSSGGVIRSGQVFPCGLVTASRLPNRHGLPPRVASARMELWSTWTGTDG